MRMHRHAHIHMHIHMNAVQVTVTPLPLAILLHLLVRACVSLSLRAPVCMCVCRKRDELRTFWRKVVDHGSCVVDFVVLYVCMQLLLFAAAVVVCKHIAISKSLATSIRRFWPFNYF